MNIELTIRNYGLSYKYLMMLDMTRKEYSTIKDNLENILNKYNLKWAYEGEDDEDFIDDISIEIGEKIKFVVDEIRALGIEVDVDISGVQTDTMKSCYIFYKVVCKIGCTPERLHIMNTHIRTLKACHESLKYFDEQDK